MLWVIFFQLPKAHPLLMKVVIHKKTNNLNNRNIGIYLFIVQI